MPLNQNPAARPSSSALVTRQAPSRAVLLPLITFFGGDVRWSQIEREDGTTIDIATIKDGARGVTNSGQEFAMDVELRATARARSASVKLKGFASTMRSDVCSMGDALRFLAELQEAFEAQGCTFAWEPRGFVTRNTVRPQGRCSLGEFYVNGIPEEMFSPWASDTAPPDEFTAVTDATDDDDLPED